MSTQSQTYMETLEPIAAGVVAASAVEIDQTGAYPRAALTALGEAARLYVTGEFQSLGTHLLVVMPGRTASPASRRMSAWLLFLS